MGASHWEVLGPYGKGRVGAALAVQPARKAAFANTKETGAADGSADGSELKDDHL